MGHPDSDLSAPAEQYTQACQQRRASAQHLRRLERRVSQARLLVFASAFVLAWVIFDAHRLSPRWLAVPTGVFIALIFRHDGIIRARRRAERAAAFYERGLARLQDRWMGSGENGARFLDPQHPYAADLDVFGPGSLFELLSTARTRAGEETLARWLVAAAPPAVIRARQAAVTELRSRLDLREDLAVLGTEVRAGLDPDALATWSAAAPKLQGTAIRWAAAAIATGTIAALAAWGLDITGPLPFLAALGLELAFGLRFRTRVREVMREVEKPARDLGLLAELLARLERERFRAPLLAELRAALDVEGEPPSRQIASLRRRIELLDARRNELFAPLAALLLWGTQCAFAVEAWRARSGPAVARWLAAVGELEALGAFAAYSFEHPGDPFPEVVEAGPWFEAEALGHPLIPHDRCIRNDLRLGDTVRVLIVSGSNMSGKSTLLRACGTNAVLALAGAPVRAAALRLSPLAVGASMRILDSLQTGTSHFYAEITRLRQLVDIAAGPSPLLFLLDEILHGTNSHDRRIGAEAVVRTLVERGSIGLVTTHDLALARIVDSLAPHAQNVHFEDVLDGGIMRFDYHMRPGVVTKSNALELMRAVGLKV